MTEERRSNKGFLFLLLLGSAISILALSTRAAKEEIKKCIARIAVVCINDCDLMTGIEGMNIITSIPNFPAITTDERGHALLEIDMEKYGIPDNSVINISAYPNPNYNLECSGTENIDVKINCDDNEGVLLLVKNCVESFAEILVTAVDLNTFKGKEEIAVYTDIEGFPYVITDDKGKAILKIDLTKYRLTNPEKVKIWGIPSPAQIIRNCVKSDIVTANNVKCGSNNVIQIMIIGCQ